MKTRKLATSAKLATIVPKELAKQTMLVIVALATAGLMGCDRGMKAVEHFVFNDDGMERAKANAAEAEAAEAEVAKNKDTAKAGDSEADLASPVKEIETVAAKPKGSFGAKARAMAKASDKPAAAKQAKTETPLGANLGAKPENKKVVKTGNNFATDTRKPASAKEMVYVVQFGAFKVKENAEKYLAKLKGDGFPVMMKPLHHSKNGDMFVVRLEPTPNRAEAEQIMAKAQKERSLPGQLISFPVEK
jgi:cell division septation protein DedD